MPDVRPDLDGFEAAQQRLRDEFGEPVTFLQEASITFPSGVPLDPETGTPHDPTIQGSATQASGLVGCTVAFRPFRGDPSESAAAGEFDVAHMMLIAPSAAASAISGAVEYDLRGDRYKVMSTKFDGVGRVQRLLTFGEKK